MYGIKTEVAEQFVKFMQTLPEAIDTFKWRKDIGKYRRKWYERADELMKLMDTMCSCSLRELFYQQISVTEALIKAYLKNNITAANKYLTKLTDIHRTTSEMITSDIIKNNPKMFG